MGVSGERHVIGRTMVRIGREEDNDICLSPHTVHRYHAVVRRTTEGEVVITDLSGDDGNGVLVNGVRVTEARLTQGDMINVGEVKLRFDARPA
jgi:pSer/pThr/pTyr-binding forkhead associated (FHA) protein